MVVDAVQSVVDKLEFTQRIQQPQQKQPQQQQQQQ